MRAARNDGALVLFGRCVDVGDGELAYAPIAGALRSLAAQVEEDELDAALGPGRAELARLVPELAGADVAPAAAPAAFGRARLFEHLLGALGRLGRGRPVVLVVEDLHWADGSTRDLLRFLVRAAAGERLALIATYRTDDLLRAHPLRPYLVELRPRRARGAASTCSRSHARSSPSMSRRCSGPAQPASARSALRALGGQPVLHRGAAHHGRTTGTLPGSLRDAMVVQLERLPARQPARGAGGRGRRAACRSPPARAGRPGPGGRARRPRCAPHWRRRARSAPDGRAYEFRHALLREAAYADLLPGEHEALHAALARELEADPELGGAAFAGEARDHWHGAASRSAR